MDRSFISRHSPLILALIIVGTLGLKLYFATQYATYTDEVLSATVAESISETGLPLLPPGTYYNRAYLHHYLLAIPVGLFGLDYLPIRINSILFSLIAVAAVYVLGARVGRRDMALLAALLLSLSSIFNQSAMTGRMYMTYATFSTLSFLFFHRGFVEGKTAGKWLAVACMVATMLSSEAGMLVGPVFGFALVLYRGISLLRDRMVYVLFGVWALLYFLLAVMDLPQAYESFTAHSGAQRTFFISTDMSIREIISNVSGPWRGLDRALPFSMPFFLLMTGAVIWRREFRRHYPIVVLLPQLVVVGVYTVYTVQHRTILAWLPLYLVSCCMLLGTLIDWCGGSLVALLERSRAMARSRPLALAAIAAAFLVLLAGFAATNGIRSPAEAGAYVYDAFGYHDKRAGYNMEAPYAYLASHVAPGDKVVVMTVEYALFFFGADHDLYYLRERRVGDQDSPAYTQFDSEREPYYGKPLIDSPEKLEALIEEGGEIWIVTDYKHYRYRHVGERMEALIEKEFQLVFDGYEEHRSRIYRRTIAVAAADPKPVAL